MIKFFLFVVPVFVLCSVAQPQFDGINERLQQFCDPLNDGVPQRSTREAARAYVTGRDLAASNHHREAISYYLQAAELDGTAPAPWAAMAESLDQLERPEAAFKAWSETLKRDPKNAKALFVVGLDCAMNGAFETAVNLLSCLRLQGVKNTPTNRLLLDVALASSLDKTGYTELSELILSKENEYIEASFTELMHGNEPVWLSVLQQLIDVGAPRVALTMASKAAPKLDKQRQAAILSAMPIIETAAGGDGSVTLATYTLVGQNDLIPLRPKWFEPVPLSVALSTAAQSMSEVGGLEGAILLYKASIAFDDSDVVALNNLAWTLLQFEGITPEAVSFAEKAYDLDSNASFIQDTLGYIKLLEGSSNEAIDLFIRALNNSNGDPQIMDHLGDAYWQSHQRRDAIEAWQRAYSTLRSPQYYQAIIEGYQSMIYSIWGVAIATPEALYDLEIGSIVRRLQEKLVAVQEGKDPFEPKNGAN
ncbi:MAG: hypothetical protein QGI78_05980 [Phycisphaerales bacterium]|nr:hypothetical protein [Phycisphaerales bacterium]